MTSAVETMDEIHAEIYDKQAASCDRMAREWAAKHCIEGYQMRIWHIPCVGLDTYEKKMNGMTRRPVKQYRESLK